MEWKAGPAPELATACSSQNCLRSGNKKILASPLHSEQTRREIRMGSLQLPHTAEEQGRVLLGDPILNKLPVFSWVSYRLMKTCLLVLR